MPPFGITTERVSSRNDPRRKIFTEVRALTETQAREVLDFVGFLKSKRHTDRLLERQAALAELARYRGRFKAEKFSRDELYDRASLR